MFLFIFLCFYSVKDFIAALLKEGSLSWTNISIKVKSRNWDLRVGNKANNPTTSGGNILFCFFAGAAASCFASTFPAL